MSLNTFCRENWKKNLILNYNKIVDYPKWAGVDRLIEFLKCVVCIGKKNNQMSFINWVFIRADVII